jgi:hypothetical protein
MVEFPMDIMGNFVFGDFLGTVPLCRDLLAALGPNGLQRGNERLKLKVTADTSSKIKAIQRACPDQKIFSVTIFYENGCEQTLPPTAILNKLVGDKLVPLEAGTEVTVNEVLGDYIDRFDAKSCSFNSLELKMGTAIAGPLEALITATSIIDRNVTPSGMLIDYRYAQPYMEKSVEKPLNEKVYLDCSMLVDLYDHEARCIIIPVSSPTYPLWELSSSSLSVVFNKRTASKVYTSPRDDQAGKVNDAVHAIEEEDAPAVDEVVSAEPVVAE